MLCEHQPQPGASSEHVQTSVAVAQMVADVTFSGMCGTGSFTAETIMADRVSMPAGAAEAGCDADCDATKRVLLLQ